MLDSLLTHLGQVPINRLRTIDDLVIFTCWEVLLLLMGIAIYA